MRLHNNNHRPIPNRWQGGQSEWVQSNVRVTLLGNIKGIDVIYSGYPISAGENEAEKL